ncbi:MAG: hypothetical protein JWO59_1166 [Chloroflexi bacterium]|nr:hypothetical protein [Chloroflexota bacterium]
MRRNPALYRANITMLLLCTLSMYYLLVSPLVPYNFDVNSPGGMGLFIAAHQAMTIVVAAIGIRLNVLADRDVQLTRETFRRMMRRGRRY